MNNRSTTDATFLVCAAAIVAPLFVAASAQAGPPSVVVAETKAQKSLAHRRTHARHEIKAVHHVEKVVKREVQAVHASEGIGAVHLPVADVRPIVAARPVGVVVVRPVRSDDWAPYYHGALNALTAADEGMSNNADNGQIRSALAEALHQLSLSSDHHKYRVSRQSAIDRTTNALHLLEGNSVYAEPQGMVRQAMEDVRACLALVDRH